MHIYIQYHVLDVQDNYGQTRFDWRRELWERTCAPNSMSVSLQSVSDSYICEKVAVCSRAMDYLDFIQPIPCNRLYIMFY